MSSTPAELKQAIDDIDKARDVVDLLVVLLKICRRHASEVVAAAQDLDMRKELRQEAAHIELAATPAFTSIVMSDTTRAFAKGILQRGTNLAVTARALALGVDQAIQKRDSKAYVKLCAKWQPDRVLAEDAPYPTPSVDLSSMYGDVGFSRRPRRNTATAFDRVGGLALWPSDSNQPLRVVYDTDAGAYLDNALGGREKVSILAVLPNRDFGTEFEADDVDLKAGRFFAMHPKYTATVTQDKTIDDALRKASDLDVDIVVTPELSNTTNTVALVKAALAKIGSGRPRVVIAGGSHIVTATSERRNRMSTIYAEPNLPVFEHDKIGEYVFSMFKMDFEEDIDRSTELRIHAGINWSMIPLICADLLDDAVVDAVADLCPRLVIVPCMSGKTGDFEMSMGAVIRKSQALVMVVNGPPDWPADKPPPGWPPGKPPPPITTAPVVVIGMPLAESWITKLYPPASGAARYAVLFSSDKCSAQFV